MQQNNLLDKLKDIHLPPAIDSQLAWGFYVLIFIIILTIAIAINIYYKKYKKQLVIKEFYRQLKVIDKNFAIKYSMLLRRYAIYYYPALKIQSFNEKQWVDFLHNKLPLNNKLKKLFISDIYKKDNNIDKKILLNYCKKWIQNV